MAVRPLSSAALARRLRSKLHSKLPSREYLLGSTKLFSVALCCACSGMELHEITLVCNGSHCHLLRTTSYYYRMSLKLIWGQRYGDCGAIKHFVENRYGLHSMGHGPWQLDHGHRPWNVNLVDLYQHLLFSKGEQIPMLSWQYENTKL